MHSAPRTASPKLWIALTIGAITVLSACADRVTGSREVSRRAGTESYTLPEIEATTCRYGGDYPACNSGPPPPDGTGGNPGTEDPWTPGGGGSEPTDSTTACDPSLDPNCEKPLTDKDKSVLQTVIGKYLRPATAFTDQQARVLCSSMTDKFSQMLTAGLVFRGSTDTHAGDPGIPEHMGAYDPSTGNIHFDPTYLDNAASGDPFWERDLANDALHEAAHALGYDHADSTPSPWGPIYAESPFNLLSPGSNSCFDWS